MKSEGLWRKLANVRFRQGFIAANVGVQIAAQLLALRTTRAKSQEKLAEEIGMNQARISLMEKPDYQKYNIQTLIRFAKYYDVALDVRFVPVREYVTRILTSTPASIAPPPFGQSPATPAMAVKPETPLQETRRRQEPLALDTLPAALENLRSAAAVDTQRGPVTNPYQA